MSQPPLEETRKLVAEDPQLLAYLPMLYVAWADGDLSADEIGSICSTVTKALDTGASCRELLGRWLDPAQPPSAQELQSLLVTIRRAARPLDADQKRSLSELGLALATGGGHQPSAAEREALVEIEQALGLAGPGVTRGLLVPERPLPAPIEPQPGFDVSAMVVSSKGVITSSGGESRRSWVDPNSATNTIWTDRPTENRSSLAVVCWPPKGSAR